MASTGEVGCLDNSFDEALLLAMEATHIRFPKKGVLISAGPEKDKLKFLEAAKILTELDIPMYATQGTADYLGSHGYKTTSLASPNEGDDCVLSAIRIGKVDLVLNIPKNQQDKELSRGSVIRQAASQFGCSLFTNMEKIMAFVKAFECHKEFEKCHQPNPMPSFINQEQVLNVTAELEH